MYAIVGTRPDVAYVVGFLARFSHAPTEFALVLAKRLLRYLLHTYKAKLHILKENADLG